MSFRNYFCDMDASARGRFAERAGSTVGYLLQVAYGNKRVELGFADVLVAVADGKLTLGDLPLTDRALEQDRRRRVVWEAVAAQASQQPGAHQVTEVRHAA